MQSLGLAVLRRYIVSFQGCFIMGVILLLVGGINTINILCKSQANNLPALESAFISHQSNQSSQTLRHDIENLKAETNALLSEVPPSMEQEVGYTPLAVDKIPVSQFELQAKHDPFAPILKKTMRLTPIDRSSSISAVNSNKNNGVTLAMVATLRNDKTED